MKRIFLMLSLATVCLTACSTHEEEVITPSANKITISPSIALTRATEMNFEEGDRIGLTIIRSDESLHAENALLTHDGNVFAGDVAWYTGTNEASHLVAYHPYDAAGAPTTFTVAADQSGDGFGKSDLMGASQPDVAPSASAVGMVFRHLLTKINVEVTHETTADVTSVVLQGAIPTADIDLKGLDVEVDETVSPSGITTQQVTKNALYRAIVVPQEVALTVVVTTSNGKTLSQPLTAATLKQGAQYKIEVTVSADGELKAAISGEIEGWTDEGKIGPEVEEVPDDQAAPKVAAGGFFVANEDWFGHDNGTVNYFKYVNATTYTPTYRAYRAVNPDEADWFGVTTNFATIWGNYAWFSSKQGNRLVVADAKTLKKKTVFPTIGGDGRAFVGVTEKKGYMGHSKGVVVVDIENMQLGSPIAGIAADQIGAMCEAEGRVFVVSQSNGLYVVDAGTDAVETNITGTYYTLTRSKDGDVWVASSAGLVRIDPETLETETIAYPSGASIGGSWGAWNAGALCASTQNNVLYWMGSGMFGAGGKTVIKYDIDTRTANTSLFTLGTSTYGTALEGYAACLRVDPLTDELIVMAKHSGWGAGGAYNWIFKLDANGNEITNFEVLGDNGSGESWATGNYADWNGKYFWFPAMPFFEDANKPQILLNQVVLAAGETKTVDLTEKIVDYDNTAASIQTSVVVSGDLATVSVSGTNLTVVAGSNPGSTTCVVTAISNGVRVEKTVSINVI